MAFHLPTGPFKKPALSLSLYRDASPVPSTLFSQRLRPCTIWASVSLLISVVSESLFYFIVFCLVVVVVWFFGDKRQMGGNGAFFEWGGVAPLITPLIRY